jgi:tight adherence protein C
MNGTAMASFPIADWLLPGFGLADFVSVLAGLAVLLTLFAIWNALRESSPFERRFAEILERREALRRVALARPRRRQRTGAVGLMRTAVTRLNLLRSQRGGQAREMLMRAGMRSPDALVAFLFAKITLPFLFGGLVLADVSWLHLIPVSPRLVPFVALAGVLAGFFAPKIYVQNATGKRAKQLQLALPDGLDLMVVCAEAGLSLDATFVRVSRELAGTWPEFAEEWAITAAELTFLPDRRMAFDNLNMRTDCEAIRSVVNTLLQTAKFGTPLAQSLRVLAAEFRTQRITKAEEKAARLPALLTVPMIIFILPTLFIVLLGPAALRTIDVLTGRAHPQTTITATRSTEAQPVTTSNGRAERR